MGVISRLKVKGTEYDIRDRITEEMTYSAYPTETASGDIVNISDGAEDIPVKTLTVAVEPVQDLHGQDSPYPAGSGKNLLDETLLSNVDANMRTITLNLEPNTQYTASTTLPLYNGTTADFFFHLSGESEGTNTNGVSASQSRTLTTGSDGVAVVAYRRGSRTAEQFLSYKYQVEKGSSATSYAPYSNICPITGWDAVNVVRVGVNQWDEVWELGNINNSTGENQSSNSAIRTKNYIRVDSAKTYYFYCGSIATGTVLTQWYGASKNYLGTTPQINVNQTFTPPTGACYLRFVMQSGYGTTYLNDVSVNYPSGTTTYKPYSGTTYPIPLPSTVYGGTLDVSTGVMTVDRAIFTLDGSETYTISGNSKRAQTIALKSLGIKYNTANNKTVDGGISNYLKQVTPDNTYGGTLGFSIGSDGTIHICDGTGSMTASEVKEMLASNNLILVLALATPQTITIDPTTISTLLGNNTLYADAGQVSVTYRADVGLYIDKRIAEVQALVLES